MPRLLHHISARYQSSVDNLPLLAEEGAKNGRFSTLDFSVAVMPAASLHVECIRATLQTR